MSDIHAKIKAFADSIPQDVVDLIPADGATNLDHYLYGSEPADKDAHIAALRLEVERLREANSQLKADIVYHVGMNLRLRGLLKEARPWLERQVWSRAPDLQDRIDKELEA